MMNNYIGKVEAEWVDPKAELPPDGWQGLVKHEIDDDIVRGASFYLNDGVIRDENRNRLLYVAAWLRIGGPSTAIPREKVQAAVDDLRETRNIFIGHARADSGGCISEGISEAIKIVTNHTGVTPSGVKESLTTEVTP